MRIAIVDDDDQIIPLLCQYTERVSKEKGVVCEIDTYLDSTKFLSTYTAAYDVIFLDIEMPEVNGFRVAQRIRALDESVCIIFVTNMAQYAILGYEVKALDFIVKPFEYYTFADKFQKAMDYLETRREKTILLLNDDIGEMVAYSQIHYMQKEKNYIIYHTKRGIFRQRGTMAEAETLFFPYGFAKCNSGCIVNLRHVKKIGKDIVLVGEESLPVSRRLHKSFASALMKYFGGSGV